GRYRLPATKWVGSMATTVGSPNHFWAELLLGSPTRSCQMAPPVPDQPIPVSEPCFPMAGVRKPVASFHAASTFGPVAAMAVSLWPEARSSFGSAASLLVPNVGWLWFGDPPPPLVSGPSKNILPPEDSMQSFLMVTRPRVTL